MREKLEAELLNCRSRILVLVAEMIVIRGVGYGGDGGDVHLSVFVMSHFAPTTFFERIPVWDSQIGRAHV